MKHNTVNEKHDIETYKHMNFTVNVNVKSLLDDFRSTIMSM